MFFFFRKPTVTIDAFVRDEYAFANEYAPIDKASKFLPQWFRELETLNKKTVLSKPNFNFSQNVKSCPGIFNSLSKGFIVPLWCDFFLQWDMEKLYGKFSDNLTSIKSHNPAQLGNFTNNHWIFKIESPWHLKFSKPTKLIFMPLDYHLGIDYHIKTAYGIQNTNTSLNALQTHQFCFLERSPTARKEITNFRTPIVHFIPFDDYDYKIKCHVDSKEVSKIFSLSGYPTSFFSRFLKTSLIEKNKK